MAREYFPTLQAKATTHVFERFICRIDITYTNATVCAIARAIVRTGSFSMAGLFLYRSSKRMIIVDGVSEMFLRLDSTFVLIDSKVYDVCKI